MLQALRRFGGRALADQGARCGVGRRYDAGSNVNKRHYSYEGDGKTTVTVLNQEIDAPLMIDAYSREGFRLNNGMHVIGPVAVFPKTVLAWNVGRASDIDVKSLSLFLRLAPKLDILIIGCGDSSRGISNDTIREIRGAGVNMEILSTDHACTTFNFLNAERRAVAAALIPPTKITFVDEEILAQQKRRDILWKDQDY